MKYFLCLLLAVTVLVGCALPGQSAPVPPGVAPASTPPSPAVSPTVPRAVAPSSPATPVRSVPWDQAASFIGQMMTVYGPVASTSYAARSNGQPTFLNLGRPYPNQGFTVVIWGRDRSKFPGQPEKYYDGKTIYVTGLIQEYRGVPEIVVTSPSQIEVR